MAILKTIIVKCVNINRYENREIVTFSSDEGRNINISYTVLSDDSDFDSYTVGNSYSLKIDSTVSATTTTTTTTA